MAADASLGHRLGRRSKLQPGRRRSAGASGPLRRFSAKELAEGSPDQERAYIAAMARRYSVDPSADRAKLAADYRQAMRDVVRAFPDDPRCRHALCRKHDEPPAVEVVGLDGTAAPDTAEIVAVLESVLAARHRTTSAPITTSFTPSRLRGIPSAPFPSAARLETLAPAAGHLVHMPAHIYARTGDHAAAARANLAGAEARPGLFENGTGGRSLRPDVLLRTTLHFLTDSHVMQGRLQDARRAAAELSERLIPHASMMPNDRIDDRHTGLGSSCVSGGMTKC